MAHGGAEHQLPAAVQGTSLVTPLCTAVPAVLPDAGQATTFLYCHVREEVSLGMVSFLLQVPMAPHVHRQDPL